MESSKHAMPSGPEQAQKQQQELIESLYWQYRPYSRRQRWKRKLFGTGKPTIHYILFFLTFLSTFATAYIINGTIAAGLWFSSGIMIILLAHEMGHYLMCRKYGVPATLPYFIPFPPLINPFGWPPIWNPFGTMGAVIRMEGRMPNRRVLFDIGAGGPLAGLVFTIPAIYFGVMMSEVHPVPVEAEQSMHLGESLLFQLLSWLAVGDVASGYEVHMHPLAFAGWAGLFVTALNLFPIGQLDGGHVMYALFGERSQRIYPIVLSIFIVISILFYIGWIPLILLLLFFRIEHPPTLDTSLGLDRGRRILAWLIFAVFIVSFTPTPFIIK